ncbi:transcription factor TFIIIB component B'' homolog isoform X2 [Cataglyphis hispanica]|uniref:transcription factor TFIIIB component B'' homolog isoform X2 n=1 Tax=Cataglyphis hispanica TaxID=1086592 RepID=UPI00217FECFD|nr:transcription factor TFIIIB component B'' homolog isoform X2 [Cataglyphis hispanica]
MPFWVTYAFSVSASMSFSSLSWLNSNFAQLASRAWSRASTSPTKILADPDFRKFSYERAMRPYSSNCVRTVESVSLLIFVFYDVMIEEAPTKIIGTALTALTAPTGTGQRDPAGRTSKFSPTKNRLCFMRPVPRLDTGGRIRKNSIQGSGASASESEDEHGKRTVSIVPSRIRNDSCCSVQSNKDSTTTDNQNISPRIKVMQKRRMQVSESARRLAEARREFLLKHENKTPDKSQMKMYDFIYYNPITNPMKSNKEQRIIAAQPMEIPEEEEEDDPPAMPVPQVKVGPDGQLIIDEQSLVIEQKDAKRVREIMSSDIIIEEGICNNGGFYKKHKRRKEWPRWETLKFYRVLNVVGTDFLLMQTLFPNRTRQEIKQKYKKEERVNRQLIEKALKYHQEFDTEMLEEQLALLQKLENIKETPKKTSEKMKNDQNITRAMKRRKHRLVAKSIGECEPQLPKSTVNNEEAEDTISTSDEIDIEINSEVSDAHQQMRKGSKARKRRLDDKSDNSDDDSHFNSDSDSSPEIYRVRPTRSGRQPKKMKKLQAPNVNKLNIPNVNAISDGGIENESSVIGDENVISSHVEVTEVINTSIKNDESVETSCPENITNVIPNINQMEPGSLVIVSKESAEEPGNTILQVYMVSSNIDNINAAESTADQQNLSDSVTTKSEIDELTELDNDKKSEK